MPSSPRTLPALLRAAAEAYGDAPAYVEGTATLSYRDLLEQVRRAAAHYHSTGLADGDRVVIWAPNSTGWAVAALAVTYAGGVLVPANSRYTGHEVAELVDRTHARIVVVEDGFLGRSQVADLRAAGDLSTVLAVLDLADLPRWSSSERPGGSWSSSERPGARWSSSERSERPVETTPPDIDQVADRVSPDDVADILFTSGTTGRPKGAMSAHRQTIGVAEVWAGLGGVTGTDRYLVVNPFFHSFGYKIGIVVGLLTGAALYPVATFDVEETMRLVQEAGITALPGAPTIFQSLLAAASRPSYDLSTLRLAVTGAAVVPVVLIERMRAPSPEGLGIDQVVTAFGMTEAVVATMCRQDDPAELVATTCGRAVPGMETRIGDRGELLLRGDHVMLGYLDDPEATAAAIDEDGWLHTGDVGTLDERGNLTITDRLKDMYICGGFNVYPAEVEQVLLRHEGVHDVAVVGVPDERLGEVGRAYVVRADDALQADEVTAFARERLANFKVPREVTFVDVLPRNLSGKILKAELRDGVVK